MRRRLLAVLVAASSLFSLNAAAAGPAIGPDSNLPVPRFVSLRTQGANGRHGPGLEHRIDWIYERVGLPLRVTAESGPWRRVVDPDGATVWIHAQNLDTRRTAYLRQPSALRRNAHQSAATIAYLGAGVVGALTGCEGDWRRIAIGGRVGWVDKDALWGADDCAGV